MEERRDRKLSYLVMALFLLVVLITIPEASDADIEPNDSLDHPEELRPGTVSGEVESVLDITQDDWTREIDNDVYSIEVPGRTNLTVSLKKTDNGTGTISVRSFNEDNVRTWYWINIQVRFSGEMYPDTYSNGEGNSTTVKLVMSGNGSYDLTAELEVIPEEVDEDDERKETDPQGHYTYETAERIEPGIYNGTVHDNHYPYPRSQYYRITVPAGKVLEIVLEKTDDEEGAIYLETNLRGEYLQSTDDIMLDVNEDRTRDSGEWHNDGTEDRLVIFEVEGRGNYTIRVSIIDSDIPEPWVIMVIILLVMVFIVLASAFFPILIVIIVIVVIFKATSKKSKAKRKGRKKKRKR